MTRLTAIVLVFMPALAGADSIDIPAVPNWGSGGTYAAIAKGGRLHDNQTSIMYNPGTGELWIDAPAGKNLTSISIDSASCIFIGAPAQNLGGSFDNDTDCNIFKATFGSSFGSISFGNVAARGLSEDFFAGDLTVIGSLEGGSGLGNVDIAYPEPSTVVLALAGLACLAVARRHLEVFDCLRRER